jgi:hypothetical protein
MPDDIAERGINIEAETSQDELRALAACIRSSIQEADADLRNALRKRLNAGDALLQAQAKLLPRQWGQWLKEHCDDLATRTAELYMQVARHRAAIEAEMERVGPISLRAALRLISPRSNKPARKSKLSAGDWASATLEERRRFLHQVGLLPVLGALPPAWRAELQRRARHGVEVESNDRLNKALRTALSTNKPNEAAAALEAITRILKSSGHDLHDVALVIIEPLMAAAV